MCWAGIIDGRILPMVWFEPGSSVKGEKYLKLLQGDLWPQVKTLATRSQYWFQQDGATCHCTDKALSFLSEKFGNRVISRRSAIPWPAHSPDLNPLDYWFWGHLEQNVCLRKPETIDDLKRVIVDISNRIEENTVRKSIPSFSRRVELCARNKRNHFESEL